MDGLLKLAKQLADRLESTQAAIVLVVLVAGVVAVELAGIKDAFPYVIAIVALAIVAVIGLLVLHKLDRAVPAKGLEEEDREEVRALLSDTRDAVAESLDTEKAASRANVIAENRLGRLQMIGDLRVNMDGAAEWGVSMRSGQGCAGVAWKTGKPHIAVHPFEGDDGLEPTQAQLVDPDLRWIVSVPILDDDGRPKWVVNVDGKEKRGREELADKAVSVVERGANRIRRYALKA